MGPRDPRISVYPSLDRSGRWTWTLVGTGFAYLGERLTEADAWRAAESVLLNCDPPATAKAAA